MSVRIVQNNYGKSRVRLLKIARDGAHRDMQSLTIAIALEGDFEEIHTIGDNSKCLPTDTMKNTVYALAGQTDGLEQIEDFGRRLASHFLDNNPQVAKATVDIADSAWKRMKFDDQDHDDSFIRGSREKRTAKIITTREGESIEAGIDELTIMKTAKSGFGGFPRDKFTFLPETTDRILATSVKATWLYANPGEATDDAWNGIRRRILKTFADHDSSSVQHTLYAIGETVLNEFSIVKEIAVSMPNIHCLPVDISKFGLEDKNCIFVPTDEPHGLIEARLAR
jgi:urate oxidase